MKKEKKQYKVKWVKGDGEREETIFSDKKQAFDWFYFLQRHGFETLLTTCLKQKKQKGK